MSAMTENKCEQFFGRNTVSWCVSPSFHRFTPQQSWSWGPPRRRWISGLDNRPSGVFFFIPMGINRKDRVLCHYIYTGKVWNKNYHVVINAGCARSRYTLKLSLNFSFLYLFFHMFCMYTHIVNCFPRNFWLFLLTQSYWTYWTMSFHFRIIYNDYNMSHVKWQWQCQPVLLWG